MKKLGILYIVTGRYNVFWEEFYESSESHFLSSTNDDIEKHYFIFTDDISYFSTSDNIHVYHQENLPWPDITLFRFSIFNKARSDLLNMDYLFFFNSNMKFVENIGKEFLPSEDKPLVFVRHPGYYHQSRESFSYETNPRSLACIPNEQGEYYFMGGVNGGLRHDYLLLIDELSKRINEDYKNEIIARWHDESHLNRYAVDYPKKILTLDSSYGMPEGSDLGLEPKIIIRDKFKYGGHSYMRGGVYIPFPKARYIISCYVKAIINLIRRKLIG
jgi:hypothetical protein